MRLFKYILIVSNPVWAQPLPSIEHMLAEKNWYFSTAVHPETHMIYARVNLGDAGLWSKTVFPKPEVIRDKTNADAELPNVSNCAFAGGLFLGQLADIAQVTHDPDAESQARTVFDGLVRLARAGPRKGFVARCLLPGDSTKAHFANSSVDQYTFFVYGLYKYYHSGLAGEAEKRAMREVMAEICAMIEHDGTILASNGAPGWVSDIEAIRSDRSSRMLEVFLVGYDITGDKHLRDVYLERVREWSSGRLRTMLDPKEIRWNYSPRDLRSGQEYADVNSMWQTQYSLVPLVELETDLALKAAYLEAMRINARIAARYGKNGVELQIIMLAQNRSVFSPVRTAEDQRFGQQLQDRCAALLAATPRWRVDRPRGDPLAASITSVGLDLPAVADTFWTGYRLGVFDQGAKK
jgi:hypothetical protein